MFKISHSKASTARQCWKKYDFKYNYGLKPKHIHPKLHLGKIYHNALHLRNTGADNDEVVEYIDTTYNDIINESELTDKEDLILGQYIVKGMFLSYPYNTSEWEEFVPEEELEVPLCPGVDFRGRVDGRVKWNGHWWVWEYKTTGMHERMFRERSDSSGQATGYVYAARKAFGEDFAGVYYDAVKRPLLRKRKTETVHDFGQRVLADYLDRPEFYHMRHPVYRSKEEVARWVKDTCDLARDIRIREIQDEWYRNTDSCYRFNSECLFKKICNEDELDKDMVEMFFTTKEEKDEQPNV